MNDSQWQKLLDVITGKLINPLPVGFIIDCPWLPGWAGLSTIDYFTDDQIWFETNLKAIREFPEIIFLPGFWAEYGMSTEPSAFGAKCVWHQDDMPFAEKMIHSITDIDRLGVPDPKTDGLAPFVIRRMVRNRPRIEKTGHAFRFAVTRGPLNIASFLMGATEFLLALRDDTRRIHTLLSMITEFSVNWLNLQRNTCSSMDGIMVLDDIVGFCGPGDFEEFAQPYLKAIFESQDVSVKMFHNDAEGRVCASYLADLGINLFNFSFMHSLDEMKEWTSNKVTLLGNLPPRDCLALGTPGQVKEQARQMLETTTDPGNIIFSCGGGMPDGVTSDNIRAFLSAIHKN